MNPAARLRLGGIETVKFLFAVGIVIGLLYAAAPASHAAATAGVAANPAVPQGSNIILVANGCGFGWYRGPGGACHRFGAGPYPGGYYGRRPYYIPPYGYYGPNPYNGCPPGYWRGPWGGCRNTPYHGRLPDGSWQ